MIYPSGSLSTLVVLDLLVVALAQRSEHSYFEIRSCNARSDLKSKSARFSGRSTSSDF